MSFYAEQANLISQKKQASPGESDRKSKCGMGTQPWIQMHLLFDQVELIKWYFVWEYIALYTSYLFFPSVPALWTAL